MSKRQAPREPLNAHGFPVAWEGHFFDYNRPSPAALRRAMRLLIQFASKGGDGDATQEKPVSTSLDFVRMFVPPQALPECTSSMPCSIPEMQSEPAVS